MGKNRQNQKNNAEQQNSEVSVCKAEQQNLEVNFYILLKPKRRINKTCPNTLTLISKILEACGIDLKREPKKKMAARECEINASTSVWNTGIFLDMDGTYKYKDEFSTSSSDPPPPPPAPEGGYSNEALYNKICSVETTMMKNYRE